RLNGYSLARYEPDDELDGIWTREQLLEMGAPVRGLRFFTRVAVRPLAPDPPGGRTRRADRASAPAAIDLGSGAYLEMAPFYRPEAPNGGWGRIELTAEEMRDLDRLDRVDWMVGPAGGGLSAVCRGRRATLRRRSYCGWRSSRSSGSIDSLPSPQRKDLPGL